MQLSLPTAGRSRGDDRTIAHHMYEKHKDTDPDAKPVRRSFPQRLVASSCELKQAWTAEQHEFAVRKTLLLDHLDRKATPYASFGVDIILIRYASHSLRYDITLRLFCFFFPAHPLKGILPKNPSVFGQKIDPENCNSKNEFARFSVKRR